VLALTALVLAVCVAGSPPVRRHLAIPPADGAGAAEPDGSPSASRSIQPDPARARPARRHAPSALMLLPFLIPLPLPLAMELPLEQPQRRPPAPEAARGVLSASAAGPVQVPAAARLGKAGAAIPSSPHPPAPSPGRNPGEGGARDPRLPSDSIPARGGAVP